jgi:menaquinone-specific isochorismate synthase
MIEIKEQVETLLDTAIQQLQSDDDVRLVSITKKITEADPLRFFEAAKNKNKDRTFWTSTTEDFYLVGIGNAYQMIATESRYNITEEKWNNILADASVHNPYQAPGTGVVALGGMDFDPKKKRTSLWQQYQASDFTIPEMLLTKSDGEFYFTSNIQVRKSDHAKQLAKNMRYAEMKLFTDHPIGFHDLSILEKEDIEPEQWKKSVLNATEAIQNSDLEKIVLAREVRVKFNKEVNVAYILNDLIQTQPHSYIFAFEKGEDCFVGATPERLIKLKGDQLLSTCLAGTAPRGRTIQEDIKISRGLLQDEKNRQEHDFVVQMIKTRIKDYCTDLEIPEDPVIYPLKNLQHLYTPVTGILKKGYSIFDIIKQLHPTPALGGTPKGEALAYIRNHELLDRGWYGAPIGWLDSNRNGEFAVAIRSGLIQQDEASLFAGCGVVKDSDPEAEYEETNIKLLPMLSVLGG